MEIIEIRFVYKKDIFKNLDLADFIQSIETEMQPEEIKLFRHKYIETDFSIHLYYDPGMYKGIHNSSGLHLSSLLKEWGFIHHSVWIEEENIINILRH